MKIQSIFVLVTLFFISLINLPAVYAKENQETTLTSYKKDITGDNQPEKIQLMRNHDKKIEIKITTASEKIYKIPLAGKQKPKISFKDLNQDHVKDMFIAVSGKAVETTHNKYQLYSFKNEQLSKIELPEALTLTTQYVNDYKASIQINQSGKAYTVDLHNRKKSFDQMGIYHNGNLNEPTELNVHAIEYFKPVRLSDLSMGLKGKQPIGDVYNGDTIAYVNSIWKWNNERWELQKTVVKKVKKK